MSEKNIRHKHIPGAHEIPYEEYMELEDFLGFKYFEKKITDALFRLIRKINKDIIDAEIKIFIEQKFGKEIEQLAEFLSNEVVRIFSGLRLSEIASKTIFNFDSEAFSASVREINGFYHINIPLALTTLYVMNPGNETLVSIIESIAHEAFHIYVLRRYIKTDIKTILANQSPNQNDYERDRGEIAAEIFALQYLKQRSAEAVHVGDSALAVVLEERYKKTKIHLDQRTQLSAE